MSSATRHPIRLFDGSGKEVHIGATLGRGGEGAVYEITGSENLVAKLYHQPPSTEKAEKLRSMARLSTPALLEVAAWPTSTLHLTPGGQVAGLAMPRVSEFSEIHQLYSPAHRKVEFPSATWRVLLGAARNTAEAFERIHGAGHVIGDVNQANTVASKKATIKLVDCDSWQVRDGGRIFPCEVGVAHFTPPELQGRSFRGIERTTNHDNFGLAVLIFHLLFVGRHPFAGRYSGHGDMPLERAIEQFRFAFGREAGKVGMAPPPLTPSLLFASADVAMLFERAFARDGVRDGARPGAHEWRSALDRLLSQIKSCERLQGHWYFSGLAQCPWCQIESIGGPDLFISVNVAVRRSTGFDLQATWNSIQQIRAPLATNPIPVVVTGGAPMVAVRPIPWTKLALHRVSQIAWAGVVFLIAAVMFADVSFGLGWPVFIGCIAWVLEQASSFDKEREERRSILQNARQVLAAREDRWKQHHQAASTRFQGALSQASSVRKDLQAIEDTRNTAHQKLIADRHTAQLDRWLERFFLDHAKIKGVGPSRISVLQSFGIETAADVKFHSVAAVPGFGPKLTGAVVAWRKSLEARFVFDDKKGVDPRDVAAVNQRIDARRAELEKSLLAAEAELKRISTQCMAGAAPLEQEVRDAVLRVRAAEANLAGVG